MQKRFHFDFWTSFSAFDYLLSVTSKKQNISKINFIFGLTMNLQEEYFCCCFFKLYIRDFMNNFEPCQLEFAQISRNFCRSANTVKNLKIN